MEKHKMIKKGLLILLCLPMIGYGQQTNQIKIVKNAANIQFSDYLEKIPLGLEEMFGFNDREDFNRVKIGIPYEVFTLKSDFFDDENIKRNKNYIISTGHFRVPIIVDNEYRVLLTVSNLNKTYDIVKIGGKGLAKELAVFRKNHPSINTPNILRVFQLKGDFILTSDTTIYPLDSASNDPLIDKKMYTINELLVLMKIKFNYEK